MAKDKKTCLHDGGKCVDARLWRQRDACLLAKHEKCDGSKCPDFTPAEISSEPKPETERHK